MKLKLPVKSCLVFVTLSLALTVHAAPPVSAADQAQIKQLKKTYPLTACPVSGDDLAHNDMGEKPVDYLYVQKNKDGTETKRLVRFCCKDCLAKFKRNPDKYLKTLDDAAAKKAN